MFYNIQSNADDTYSDGNRAAATFAVEVYVECG